MSNTALPTGHKSWLADEIYTAVASHEPVRIALLIVDAHDYVEAQVFEVLGFGIPHWSSFHATARIIRHRLVCARFR